MLQSSYENAFAEISRNWWASCRILHHVLGRPRMYLIDIINVSNRQNLLAKSMRSAILTLDFKGKDSSKKNERLYLKNWRPISLLNIYYKIGAKGPANCLQNVLYHVINPDQTVQNPTQGMWLGFKEGQTTGPVDIQWTN